jgi:hypothetical protein
VPKEGITILQASAGVIYAADCVAFGVLTTTKRCKTLGRGAPDRMRWEDEDGATARGVGSFREDDEAAASSVDTASPLSAREA